MKTGFHHYFILLALLAGIHQSAAQGTTAFTYQGQLHDGGTNANGTYTMIFALYDSASNGNQIGSAITTTPTLANGLFAVNLDFGNVFTNDSARWLDITIQAGTNNPETLTPRVQILPSPYALYSSSAGSAANATTATAAGSLASGTWSASVGTYQEHPNVLGFSDNGTLILGLYDYGVVATNLQAYGNINAASSIYFFNGGGDVYSDGNGGLTFNDGTSGINQDGSISFLNGGGSIHSDGNGGLTFNNGDAGIDQNGNISTFNEINVNHGTTVLSPNGDIQAGGNTTIANNINAGGWVTAQGYNTSSDRNLKEKFTPIDNREILERVAGLPISSWNFKTDANTRHIGPMAQDFYAAFNVGTDDKHIATVDESGVALAAIQGLNEKLKEKDAQIEALNKRLADLEQLVKTSTQK